MCTVSHSGVSVSRCSCKPGSVSLWSL